MTFYDKLVRDKIPEILKEKGKECVFFRAKSDEEYLSYLKKKLLEEAEEFNDSPSIEELADIADVMSALMSAMEYTTPDLVTARIQKAQERGSFNERWILLEAEDD